jgi:4-alpha-glucanotransferase
VRLIGDLPIFVSLDSADVRDRPELFRLDARGRPVVVTGVPPDCFSKDGQLWEHPHYRWAAHRRERFAWWISRVRIALERFDALRIDHFVGLKHAYEIPGAATHARRGVWRPTPGRELLGAIRARLGDLPLIAEDLGALTPAVERLRDDFALPGMKLLHNAFYGPDSRDLPHHHPRRCVVYPGTHDNDTTRGWWKSLPRDARERFVRFAGADPARPEEAMVRLAYGSPANTAIVAAQDLLGLGRAARMNVPGLAEGNWAWRLQPNELRPALADRLKMLAVDAGRLAL